MDKFFDIDWGEMFVPETSLLEIIIRGSILYLVLFAFLRLARREAGAISITDILVIVLIADASQNGMAGDYKSITEGIVLVVTIFFWNKLLSILEFKFKFAERILRPPKLLLIKDGKLIRRNLRQEMITNAELMSEVRQQGIEKIEEIEKAYLEGDGNISFIKKESGNDEQKSETNAQKTAIS
ncbi:MAG: DUF421 domain-containing protein [Pyrinomonadaceae bacterium]|nr:DUF421 domain-containing protein [Pyrinomonadaceae bacterium]